MATQRAEFARDIRVPHISQPLLRFFRFIVRRNLRRGFHAVRGHNLEAFRALSSEPLVVYMNHASWWDPLTIFLLFQQQPHRDHFGPMDTVSLRRYRILARLGLFPVETNTARGGLQFLRTAQAILASGGVIWVTPQGRFADIREPLVFKPGLATLAARSPSTVFLPLAIEYTFWDERTPELLLAFGEPQRIDPAQPAAIDTQLAAALERTMHDLAERALTRSPASFAHVLLRGRVGVGGFYAIGERIRAILGRRPYRPEHTPTEPQP